MKQRLKLFFSHANGIVPACYEELLAELATDYEILPTPILGNNSGYPITKGWHHLVDELTDILEPITQKEPVVLVGHSMGGLINYLYANKYPKHVHALIMLDPPMMVGFHSFVLWCMWLIGKIDSITPAGKSKFRKEFWQSREQAGQILRSRGLFKTFTEKAFQGYMSQGLTPVSDLDKQQLDDKTVQYKLTISVKNEIDIFRTVPSIDFWLYLPKNSEIPTAFITASESEFAKRGIAKNTAKHLGIPCIIAEGEHMFPVQFPEPTATLIKAELNKLLTS